MSIKDNTFCCVPQCNSKGSRNPELSFHKFPSLDSKLYKTCPSSRKTSCVRIREEWIRLLRIGKAVSERMRVCSKHFNAAEYHAPLLHGKRRRLKPFAVPSLFLPISRVDNPEKCVEKQQAAITRCARYEEINRKKTSLFLPAPSPAQSCPDQPSSPAQSCSPTQYLFRDQELDAADVLLSFSKEVLIPATKEVGVQVCSGDLKLGYLIKASELSDLQMKSLTGIPTMAQFNHLVVCVEDLVKIGNRHYLKMEERMLLTFMKLKLNLSFSSLAVFFGCTNKTVGNIFRSLIPVLSSIFEVSIVFQSKDTTVANMPNCFKSFPNVRVVLDCTEIVIQKPKCLTERIDTYSQYYGDHTVKYMIVITPGGLVSYVSKGYGGRTSDKLILEHSHVMEMLEPHIDDVMVDKGFLIEDMCKENFIGIVRPPFLKKKKQFSAGEAVLARNIASARVHVERAIQRIKILNILKGPISPGIFNVMDHIMVICAGLANLNHSILACDKYEYDI